MSRRVGSIAGQVVLAGALFLVVGWPALATGLGAWGVPVGKAIAEAGGATRPLGLAWTTAKLVLLTEALALPLGSALAWLLFRTDLPGRRLLIGLTTLALFVPVALQAVAWLGSFGNQGRSQAIGAGPLLTGLPGAAFVHAIVALPWVILLVGVGLRVVERELEESALIDLPPWRVALQVSLRRAVGAIAGAALATAVLTAGDMTITDLLQVRTYAEESYLLSQLLDANTRAVPALIALPMALVLGPLILLTARALLRADPARLPTASARPRVWPLGRWRVPLALIVWLTFGNAIALPIYGLVWRAGRVGRSQTWTVAGLKGTLIGRPTVVKVEGERGPVEEQRWVGGAWNDVKRPLAETTLWATVGATATTALAWALAWVGRRRGAWRWVVAAVAVLTLSCPGPVAGQALALAYSPYGLIYDNPTALVIGYVFRALPFALLILWPALRAIPGEALDAAMIDGYGPLGLARRVALPASWEATLAAWGASFILAMGELATAYILQLPGHTPLSVVVWGLLHTGVESHLAGIGLILLGLVGLVGLLPAWALDRLLINY